MPAARAVAILSLALGFLVFESQALAQVKPVVPVKPVKPVVPLKPVKPPVKAKPLKKPVPPKSVVPVKPSKGVKRVVPVNRPVRVQIRHPQQRMQRVPNQAVGKQLVQSLRLKGWTAQLKKGPGGWAVVYRMPCWRTVATLPNQAAANLRMNQFKMMGFQARTVK
jgi:outer membrane biosynthesis protein TonB